MKQRVFALVSLLLSSMAVAGDQIELVGLHLNPIRFNPAQDTRLFLSSPLARQALDVRVQSIPLSKNYQETLRSSPEGLLELDLSKVTAAQLSAEELGVVALLPDEMYLPLAINTNASTPRTAAPVAVLRTPVAVSKITWRYAEALQGQCQRMQTWLVLDSPSGYRAGEAITIDLPDTSAQICVEVVGKPRVGKNWLQGLWRIQLEAM